MGVFESVLIVAKCIVNVLEEDELILTHLVLIVAKCIVNIDYINGLGRAEISINSSKVYCKYVFSSSP